MVKARCVLMPGSSNQVTGTITFEQSGPGTSTRLTGQIKGLTPGKHGIAINEFGDYSEGCSTMGKRFNPKGKEHAGPTDKDRMSGDLGNVEAGEDGVANVDMGNDQLSLIGANSIIGRSFVVHEKEDDLGKGHDEESRKTGKTGQILACGIIGITK